MIDLKTLHVKVVIPARWKQRLCANGEVLRACVRTKRHCVQRHRHCVATLQSVAALCLDCKSHAVICTPLAKIRFDAPLPKFALPLEPRPTCLAGVYHGNNSPGSGNDGPTPDQGRTLSSLNIEQKHTKLYIHESHLPFEGQHLPLLTPGQQQQPSRHSADQPPRRRLPPVPRRASAQPVRS